MAIMPPGSGFGLGFMDPYGYYGSRKEQSGYGTGPAAPAYVDPFFSYTGSGKKQADPYSEPAPADTASADTGSTYSSSTAEAKNAASGEASSVYSSPTSGVKAGERPDRPMAGFEAPILMQTQGQEKIDRADKTFANPDASRTARERARTRREKGRDMRKMGQIAEGFQNASERREARQEDGKNTRNQIEKMDRRYGKAVRRFGADKANEMASAYGEKRYSSGGREFTDVEKDQATDKLARLERRRDRARAAAGNKNYRDIKGTGEVGNKRRAAALRARNFNKKINREIGRATRRYGSDVASSMAQTAGVGQSGF